MEEYNYKWLISKISKMTGIHSTQVEYVIKGYWLSLIALREIDGSTYVALASSIHDLYKKEYDDAENQPKAKEEFKKPKTGGKKK